MKSLSVPHVANVVRVSLAAIGAHVLKVPKVQPLVHSLQVVSTKVVARKAVVPKVKVKVRVVKGIEAHALSLLVLADLRVAAIVLHAPVVAEEAVAVLGIEEVVVTIVHHAPLPSSAHQPSPRSSSR